MSEITIVTPDQFGRETSQPPGSERLAAVCPSRGIATPLWGGLFAIEPGARTGIHHTSEPIVVNFPDDHWS
jgi:uncharacterized RmlC-like cupin family protein